MSQFFFSDFVQIRVLIPARVHQHHEPDAALHHSPRQQAVGPELLRRLVVDAVHVERRRRLLRKVQQFRARRLHPERQLIRSDARRDLRIARLGQLLLVQIPQRIQRRPLRVIGVTPGGLLRYRIGSPVLAKQSCPDTPTAETRSRSSTRRRWFPRPSSAPQSPAGSATRSRARTAPTRPSSAARTASIPVNSNNWPG